EQLAETGNRFAVSLEHGGSLPDDHDGDEHGDDRRQATSTFGARLVGSTVTSAAVVRPTGIVHITPTPHDSKELAGVP
ncbi:two-component sensor histidine kinase, partial [Xylella fastidiosa subsp. multiplex]|nr:two-component sensor histidine kinase [Xylella fastidiosa subsp. multiplex]